MRFINRTGQRYGMLQAIGVWGRSTRKLTWACLCDCGNVCVVMGDDLRSGNTKSCGCQAIERGKAVGALKKHGHYIGDKPSPTYVSWAAMRNRCSSLHRHHRRRYFDRGITVCPRWLNSFENFLADMGERPIGCTLDRRDNDKGYTLSNCRWATPSEQAKNRNDSSRKRNQLGQFM
jgi:hypothetical protein